MVLVLGVNGSPRRWGNTARLLRIALRAAELEGARTKLIDLTEYEVKPCIGCVSEDIRSCRYPCVVEDDMRSLYDQLLEAEALILATPIYWYSPSGLAKNFIDRLTALENMAHIEGRSWLEGKVAGVLAVGDDGGGAHVVATLLTTLVAMGFHIPPFAYTYYQQPGDILKDDNTLLEAANVGRVVTLAAHRPQPGRWFSNELRRLIPEWRKELVGHPLPRGERRQ
jgi:multimeric flavodoxin WrbA